MPPPPSAQISSAFRPSPWREAAREASALVFPVNCAGCGIRDHSLCPRCQLALRQELSPRAVSLAGFPVMAAGSYAGIMRRALLAYKERGRRELAGVLGTVLGTALQQMLAHRLTGGPAIQAGMIWLRPVGIPSSARAEQDRGFRPIEELIERLRKQQSRQSSARILPQRRLLQASKDRQDQVGLGKAERARNGQKLALSRRALRGAQLGEVILVDDVLTTGASMRAAADRLQTASVQVAFGLVLCVTSGSFVKQ